MLPINIDTRCEGADIQWVLRDLGHRWVLFFCSFPNRAGRWRCLSLSRWLLRRFPLTCKLFSFSYLFWAHALREKVSEVCVFGFLRRRQVEPHVRTDIVTGEAVAVGIHQPESVLGSCIA